MAEPRFFIDDNIRIPEEYRKMSLEEVEAELKRLIEEDKKQKRQNADQ